MEVTKGQCREQLVGPAADLPTETEVLIVGLGPVGAAVASLLGGYGVRTVVVDKATEVFAAPRAIALDNEALRILQMAGLPEGAFDTLAIPRVVMQSPQAGLFACVNTAGSIDGHPKLVTFFQPDLERALRERLRSLNTITTLLGCEFLGVSEREHAVTAQLRMADGRERVIEARYLVAADGASSKLRAVVSCDFGGKTYGEDWLIVDAVRKEPAIDHVEFRCDPARPGPHMPAPGGRERWEFMLKPGETREAIESNESIRRLLAPWGNAAEMRIERRAVYRFHARVASRFSKGRIFLCGDAAHITPPFVGQGLVAGLRDAANLSWKLAWVIKGRAKPGILDSYDSERRPHARAMIRLARLMGRFVMPSNPFTALLIHTFLRQLRRIPPLRRHFDDLGIKPKNCFASGLFVRGRGNAKLVRGGVLPQGWLRNDKGEIVLSDEVLGPSLTLLSFGGEVESMIDPETLADFSAAGGRIVPVGPRGQRHTPRSDGRYWEDLSDSFIPTAVPPGWVAIVRPDRTVLHDGPIADARRLLCESLQLLGAPVASAPSTLSALSTLAR